MNRAHEPINQRPTRPNRISFRRVRRALLAALLVAATLVYLLPLFFMILTSLKTLLDQAMHPLGLPKEISFESYQTAIREMRYLRAIFNTLVITGLSAVLIVITASLAAYPLARIQRRLTTFTYQFFWAGLSMPFFMIMIPLYEVMNNLHLINTHVGVVLLYTALNIPFSVFFYTSFINTLPKELEESAVIDGAGTLQVFWLIVFPMLRPITATIVMFVSLSVWNDFLLPLLFLYDSDAHTVMVAVFSFVGRYGFEPTQLFSAAVLGALPLLVCFFFLQRYIIAGIAAGAIKG